MVPLVAPAMAAGILALAGGAALIAGAPPVLGAVVAAPGWVILRILVLVVQTAAGLPFASVTLVPPFDVIAAGVTTIGLVAVTWWRRRRRGSPSIERAAGPPVAPSSKPATNAAHDTGRRASRAAVAGLIVAIAVAGSVVAARPASSPRVSILDVGQGDAILVEGSRGGRLLIDGGPDPDRLLVALDRRIPPWDRRIDAVIMTHPHEDHVAGFALLLKRYEVGRVFETGMRGPGPGYAAWLRELAGPNAPVRLSLAAGDRLAVDDVGLRVLWPIRGEVPTVPPSDGTGINNFSVILLGRVGERRFLLMGDAEEGVDRSLLTEGLPRVDLLKVAHHGSRTATTQAFIDAVRPAVAVASVGAGNPYGHPTKATIDRLVTSGARVLRTDRDGSVVVGFEATAMTVRTEGARPMPTPRATRAEASGPAATLARLVPVRSPQPEVRPDRCRAIPVSRRPSGTIEAMTVPGRVDAASLLLSLDPPPWFVRHARAVAEVAGWLAARIDARGTPVDRRLVESAALLHDADKALPKDDPARTLPHGDGSAAWLTRHDHPELARAVAGHPVTRLLDGERYTRWAAFASREERIVAYADKRAGQRLESMDARFASWRRRYPRLDVEGRAVGWDEADLRAVRARAARLEADVCRAAGVSPGDVRRLAWTGPALRAARDARR